VSFHDVLFPDDQNYATAGGPGHNTRIVVLDSGQEQRIPRWNGARRQYEINYDDREHPKLFDLQEFIIARQGATHSFRLRDFHDCSSSLDGIAPELGGASPSNLDVLVGTGDGVETDFQLDKYYSSGSVVRTRTIFLPRSGTVLVAVAGNAKTEGVHYTVNYLTGIITFSGGSVPAVDEAVTAGFQFDTPVRFSKDTDELLSTPIKNFGVGDAVNVSMVEDMDMHHWSEERYLGGSSPRTVTADILLSETDATVQLMDVQASGKKVRMPDTAGLPGGGPWFYLINDGIHSIDVYDNPGALILFTLAPGEFATVVYEATDGNWWAGVC
jgi:uncharacterized protein (TIGR02217 family)